MASKSQEHTKSGNCWLNARKCKRCGADNLCDVCHKHDLPRGECDECPPCMECEAVDKEAGP